MSYRLKEPKPHNITPTLDVVASPMDIIVTNGTTSEHALPCWYFDAGKPRRLFPHNWRQHDFEGYPGASKLSDHSEDICQLWHAGHCTKGHLKCLGYSCRDFLDLTRVWPILFADEGYTSIDVRIGKGWVGQPPTPPNLPNTDVNGLVVTPWIDTVEKNIIRIHININTDLCDKLKGEWPVSVYATSPATPGTLLTERIDCVAVGRLIVLPAQHR